MSRFSIVLGEKFGIDDDPALGQVGNAFPERDHGGLAARLFDFENVARAEILDGDDGTERMTLGILAGKADQRSEEHTSELQSLMRISYAVFCLKKKNKK